MRPGPTRLDLRGTIPDAEALVPAVRHLRSGGILGYPTETVYGFGGACTPEAVERIRQLKRREAGKPLLVLIRGMEDADALLWTDEARELATIFWPGSVTIILEDPRGVFPPGIRSPGGAVAVRVSPHPIVGLLLDGLGGPLTSTSANAPGRPPARSGEEALEAAVALGVDSALLVVDGGELPPSESSTVVDCTGPEPWVVREGTVPISRLRCALPGIHGR